MEFDADLCVPRLAAARIFRRVPSVSNAKAVGRALVCFAFPVPTPALAIRRIVALT